MEEMTPSTPQEAAVALEHCMMAGANSPNVFDGGRIVLALRLVADFYWPDLATGATLQFNEETGEIEVETGSAFCYISSRAVER